MMRAGRPTSAGEREGGGDVAAASAREGQTTDCDGRTDGRMDGRTHLHGARDLLQFDVGGVLAPYQRQHCGQEGVVVVVGSGGGEGAARGRRYIKRKKKVSRNGQVAPTCVGVVVQVVRGAVLVFGVRQPVGGG